MTARVHYLTAEQWKVLEPILQQAAATADNDDASAGLVLITPAAKDHLRRSHGMKVPRQGEVLDYDFGGSPDIQLDVLHPVPPRGPLVHWFEEWWDNLVDPPKKVRKGPDLKLEGR